MTKVALAAFCVRETKSLSQAVVLGCLLEDYLKTGNDFVKTAKELEEESGLKDNTISHALRELQKEGFITKKIQPHPTKPRILRSSHICLTDKALQLMTLATEE